MGFEVSESRYLMDETNWRVEDEIRRLKKRALALTAVFSGLFSGLLLFGFSYYSQSPGDSWMVALGLFLFCLMLVALLSLLNISTPKRAMFFKEYALRPSTLDTLVKRAAASTGLDLIPMAPSPASTGRMKVSDVYRTYGVRGRESRITIVRNINLKRTRTEVSSLLEMGPQRFEEDEKLDRFANAVDAQNLLEQEDPVISFGEYERAHSTCLIVRNLASVANLVLLSMFLSVNLGMFEEGSAVANLTDPFIFLLLVAILWGMISSSAKKRLYLARMVTAG